MGYSSAQAKEFINRIAPLMVSEAKARGYKIVSTAIAQAIIEGAAGTSRLAKTPYFNHFGLKAGKAWLDAGKPAVNMRTKEEYVVGSPVTISDYFRVYANDSESVKGYYDFINTKRYSNLKTANTYVEYAQMLKADGYATSSTYINTLCSTVEKYDLIKYDLDHDINMVKNVYIIGKTYTLQSDLYIRLAPNGDKLEPKSLTTNAQMNAFTDDDGYAILRKGTKVTCKMVKNLANSVWMQIPSGWICARNLTNIYVI